ncbi:hypothetical protein DBT_0513 [Dissulfuribacter thermophilus]|uniref:Uncharacterized protein n=1 Tax=Dissulfuribacter thermophilus TaxID=1156395 RepID=A0A1B9F8E8_9BACT|nr:hypothetical protein DBT_0513 [Dissulfuribacter thermophilus]
MQEVNGDGPRSLDEGLKDLHSRGKSGLHRARWSVTRTGGDPRESATENRPPAVDT